MSDGRLGDSSSNFVLSSGTVSIDISESVVLALYYPQKKEFFLPKGRKNVGETLQAAAVRETMEESGYQCQLLEHNLQTQAPNLTPGPWTTEPIAIHQRVTNGIRKIIFWYLAQVNSSSLQMLNTQEEGEDFEVHWISLDMASAKMTYEEDQEVVSIALAAVAQRAILLNPLTATDWFREQYLNPSINMSTLGLLCVCLGGSVVSGQSDYSHPQDVEDDRDWDGIGIVERKEDIIRLANHRKADLCKLLRIDTEEQPSLTIPDGARQGQWDILRFSGRTAQGSKRTIKIWSADHVRKVAAEPTPSPIGVLSYKVVRFTQREHPLYGPRLFVYQPFKIADKLWVLQDTDFLEALPSEPFSASTGSALQDVCPGVSCDLLLTSTCLFEQSPGLITSLKAALLRKWQAISGSSSADQIIPFFYRASAFTACYRQKLHEEFTYAFGQTENQLFPGNDTEKALHGTEVKVGLGQAAKGYHMLHFAPLSIQTLRDNSEVSRLLPRMPHYHTVKYDTQEDLQTFHPTCFSSNSVGSYARIRVSSEHDWEKAYVKKAPTVSAELKAFSIAQQYFPKEALQTVITTDGDCIFYKRFEGETLNETRLRHHLGLETSVSVSPEDYRLSEEWFLNIELRRAQDVLAAYMRSFTRHHAEPTGEQRIHSFFHHRLVPNCRLQTFYENSSSGFMDRGSDDSIKLESFMDLPVTINGTRYKQLRYYLDRASEVLDPGPGRNLDSLPVAFGLGDGHGGNVMVSGDQASPLILYVDYEITGFHTPYLDLAKPIYQDSFFNIAYADFLSDDLTRGPNASGAQVCWKLEGKTLSIDYSLRLGFLSRGLAVTKLEYLLRPMLEMLRQTAPALSDRAEETLSYGLFACALLTRDYSSRPDVFFLNLAVGVRLASEMREILADCFEWCNWPTFAPSALQLSPIRGTATNRFFTKRVEQHDDYLAASSGDDEIQILVEKLIMSELSGSSQFTESVPRNWNSRSRVRIPTSLAFDVVNLNRVTDTLQLHQQFSEDQNEYTELVMQRISHVWKKGMELAPHTCIKECLFAEPRIDRHFTYEQVMSDIRVSPKTLIDVGCCMGTDIRKLIYDGYPAQKITGLDCERGFLQLGFALYNQLPGKCAVRFREADVLHPRFRERCSDLADQFDFVHSANVIHLFDECHQEQFLRSLAFLVRPGGMIWGRQVGLEDNDLALPYRQPEGKGARFTMNEFQKLWANATGWDTGGGRFTAKLVEYDELKIPRADKRWSMQWTLRAPAEKASGSIVTLE